MTGSIEGRKKVLSGIILSGIGALILFGLLLAFFPKAPFMKGLMSLIQGPFFGSGAPEARSDRYATFIFGVLAGTMTGWASLLAFIVLGPMKRGEAWTFPAIITSLLAWFVLDTGASLYYGVLFNALGNFVILLWISVPLLILKRIGAFRRSGAARN